MPRARTALSAVAVLALAVAMAPQAIAGPLNPPPGPIGSTGPAVVNALPGTPTVAGGGQHDVLESGSFIFNGNISVDPAANNNAQRAIDVTADNVTIDMNGFTLEKTGEGPSNAFDVQGDHVTIRNGTIKGFDSAFGTRVTSGSHLTIEDVTICGGTLGHVFDTFTNVTLRNVTVKDAETGQVVARFGDYTVLENVSISGGGGIVTGGCSTAKNVRLKGEGPGSQENGLDMGPNAKVEDTIVEDFGGTGVRTVSGTVTNTSVSGCGVGYAGTSNVKYTGCSATGCSGAGYGPVNFASYTGCTSANNGACGESGQGSVWKNCNFNSNAGPLALLQPSNVELCQFWQNNGDISVPPAASGSKIKLCDLYGNFGFDPGISVDAANVMIKEIRVFNYAMGISINPGAFSCTVQSCGFFGNMQAIIDSGTSSKVARIITHPDDATNGTENTMLP